MLALFFWLLCVVARERNMLIGPSSTHSLLILGRSGLAIRCRLSTPTLAMALTPPARRRAICSQKIFAAVEELQVCADILKGTNPPTRVREQSHASRLPASTFASRPPTHLPRCSFGLVCQVLLTSPALPRIGNWTAAPSRLRRAQLRRAGIGRAEGAGRGRGGGVGEGPCMDIPAFFGNCDLPSMVAGCRQEGHGGTFFFYLVNR